MKLTLASIFCTGSLLLLAYTCNDAAHLGKWSEPFRRLLGTWHVALAVLFGAGVIAQELLWVTCTYHWIELKSFAQRKKHILESVDNLTLLERIVRRGDPFALLLREFQPESRFAVSYDPSPEGAVLVDNDVRDELYEALLGPITEHMPVFGLLNQSDCSHSSHVRSFLVDDNWYVAFCAFAERASLLIIILNSPTPGIMYELNWIANNNRVQDSILVATQTAIDALKDRLSWPGFTISISDLVFSSVIGGGAGYPSVPKQEISVLKEWLAARSRDGCWGRNIPETRATMRNQRQLPQSGVSPE